MIIIFLSKKQVDMTLTKKELMTAVKLCSDVAVQRGLPNMRVRPKSHVHHVRPPFHAHHRKHHNINGMAKRIAGKTQNVATPGSKGEKLLFELLKLLGPLLKQNLCEIKYTILKYFKPKNL